MAGGVRWGRKSLARGPPATEVAAPGSLLRRRGVGRGRGGVNEEGERESGSHPGGNRGRWVDLSETGVCRASPRPYLDLLLEYAPIRNVYS